MRTVVGSIGLVLVAPITAIVAGWVFSTNFQLVLNKEKINKAKQLKQISE